MRDNSSFRRGAANNGQRLNSKNDSSAFSSLLFGGDSEPPAMMSNGFGGRRSIRNQQWPAQEESKSFTGPVEVNIVNRPA